MPEGLRNGSCCLLNAKNGQNPSKEVVLLESVNMFTSPTASRPSLNQQESFNCNALLPMISVVCICDQMSTPP